MQQDQNFMTAYRMKCLETPRDIKWLVFDGRHFAS